MSRGEKERRGIFQISEGKTEIQIAEDGNTVSDECEATVVWTYVLNKQKCKVFILV